MSEHSSACSTVHIPDKPIVLELLLLRHNRPVLVRNPLTGREMVPPLDVIPGPDATLQLTDFFWRANKRLLELNLHYTEHVSNKASVPTIHRAYSSPRLRTLLLWGSILSFQGPITVHRARDLMTQQGVEKWVMERLVAKCEQDRYKISGIWCSDVSWEQAIQIVETTHKPQKAYDILQAYRKEVNAEYSYLTSGIVVHDSLRDILGGDVGCTGMDWEEFSTLMAERKLKSSDWWRSKNFLDEAMAPCKKHEARPQRVVAVTHGANLVVLENLLLYDHHEELIVDKTYGEIRSLQTGIPHGSGLQILVYQDGSRSVERIYAATDPAHIRTQWITTTQQDLPSPRLDIEILHMFRQPHSARWSMHAPSSLTSTD